MSAGSNQPARTKAHHRRRYVVLSLFIAALIAAMVYGPVLREQEPDFYDPARAALVNARQLFEGSLIHEQALNDQLKMARAELDSAITQLDRVADLDPDHRAVIESLRASLLTIENPEHPGETSPEQLQQSYRDLLARMDALIGDIDARGR